LDVELRRPVGMLVFFAGVVLLLTGR